MPSDLFSILPSNRYQLTHDNGENECVRVKWIEDIFHNHTKNVAKLVLTEAKYCKYDEGLFNVTKHAKFLFIAPGFNVK